VYTHATKLVVADPSTAIASQSFWLPGRPAYVTVIVDPAG
jgi:hypothetical protein